MTATRRTLFTCVLLSPFVLAGCARETPTEHAANVYAAQELAAAPAHGNLPDYSLPADKLAKAQHLETVRDTLFVANTVWGLLELVLLLAFGAIAWMRDRAINAGASLAAKGNIKSSRWVQGFTFFALYSAAGILLDLPLSIYGQHIRRAYGLSVQSWGSWLGDLGKSFALEVVFGGLFVMLLFWCIRRFSTTWWLLGWGVAAVFVLIGIFASPYVIDPLFNKFEPLQQTHPELVTRLEQVAERGHMNIPPERMFLMKASAKVTMLNAYVTGFGASKRVVVWDTSLAKGTTDQVLFIFGHESGHYVLHHITRGVTIAIFGLLLAFYLGYLFVHWALARFGAQWRIPSQADWGAFAVLMLAFSILSTVSAPLISYSSRTQEHAADVYGQEAVHGLVADPQEAARSGFALLGENSFVVPNPNLLMEFWTGDHPAIGRRAAFAHAYDPWASGAEPKYFPKQ